MQHITKTLVGAALALAVSFFFVSSAMAQTTGPGDRALVNIALDRNYNCARGDDGTCLSSLPNMAVAMPDIPLMPNAGGGGASVHSHEMNRPDMPTIEQQTSNAQKTSVDRMNADEPNDNDIFIAIIVAGLAGLLVLIHQFIRQKRKHYHR